MADLTGPGKILVQTRSQDQFLSWLIPKLPQQAPTSSRVLLNAAMKWVVEPRLHNPFHSCIQQRVAVVELWGDRPPLFPPR